MCVFSVLLYAAETWTINKTDEKRILAFENRHYGWLLRISWQDCVTYKELHEQIGRPVSLMTIIKSRKLKLFGCVTRMHDGRLLKMVTFGMIEGRRPRGRPPRRLVDDITVWRQMDLCAVTAMAISVVWRPMGIIRILYNIKAAGNQTVSEISLHILCPQSHEYTKPPLSEFIYLFKIKWQLTHWEIQA